MNIVDARAKDYTYIEFPKYYRWDKPNKTWMPRKNKRIQIGRMVYATPTKGERYYLQVLLEHVRGATSFTHLRTIHGIMCQTFRDSCEAIGVVGTDESIDHCLTCTATWAMP